MIDEMQVVLGSLSLFLVVRGLWVSAVKVGTACGVLSKLV